MICIVCKKHATFEHTVFKGTSPVRVLLCPDCVAKTGAEAHVTAMKSAPDKAAKHAAQDALLKAVGR
jgi:uncharacterized protein YlaI